MILCEPRSGGWDRFFTRRGFIFRSRRIRSLRARLRSDLLLSRLRFAFGALRLFLGGRLSGLSISSYRLSLDGWLGSCGSRIFGRVGLLLRLALVAVFDASRLGRAASGLHGFEIRLPPLVLELALLAVLLLCNGHHCLGLFDLLGATPPAVLRQRLPGVRVDALRRAELAQVEEEVRADVAPPGALSACKV